MYDLVFITHLPSFYKCNLYREVSKSKKIKVIFISTESEIRRGDFVDNFKDLDYVLINSGQYEKRSIIKSCFYLAKVLKNTQSKEIVLGGWDLPEFWLSLVLLFGNKVSLCLESSEYDCSTTGIKGLLKKIFVSFVTEKAYCSGSPHIRLIQKLGFRGHLVKTLGVGLTNIKRNMSRDSETPFQGRLLYVGRLSKEKGLFPLLGYISRRKDLTLTIVGDGPLLDELTKYSVLHGNIKLSGYVDNKSLGNIYSSHDIFILPSIAEPWGLVVEEAIQHGLPVLCSNTVGSAEDIVIANELGETYAFDDEDDFNSSLNRLVLDYSKVQSRVSKFDFEGLKKYQVSSYE